MRALPRRSSTLATVALATPLFACQCGPSSVPATAPAEEADEPAPPAKTKKNVLHGWHYEVAVAPSLADAQVRVCFQGAPPKLFIPGVALGAEHTYDMRTDDGAPLRRKDRGYGLARLGRDECVRYRVDFEGLQDARGTGRIVNKRGNSLLARPSVWLWRPALLPDAAVSTIEFQMPEGMAVSVPWSPIPAKEGESGAPRYELQYTAYSWLGYAVFGTITSDRFERAGASVELVTLDAPIECSPQGLRDWIIDAIDTVALLFDGTFPRDRLQVVVLPVEGGGNGTVYFGMASRGGGPGVFVFLDDEAKAKELPGGWTTVHEFLHHGMPFIREPWMAEGWVSYYTELMRTRAGHRSEREGWQALREAFERGTSRWSNTSLAEASASMHERHQYQRVYWGGAAVAFLIDIQMRLESDGTRSLDDAMKELRRCCGDAEQRWPADELLSHLDTWYGRPLFSKTAATVLSDTHMPDIDAALARLGISTEGGVHFDDSHPAAAARRGIMAPR